MTFIKQKLIGKLDTSTSPVGLWNFDGNLNDSSGNGFNLTGTPAKYISADMDFISGSAIGADSWKRPHEDTLTITGAITLEVIGVFFMFSSAQIILQQIGSGETLGTNAIYSWVINNNGIPYVIWESGSGTDRQVNADTRINFYMPVYLAFTRNGDNPAVGSFYINGVLGGTDDDLPPEGGSSSTFAIGGGISNNSMLQRGSVLSSVRISPYVASAEKIKNTYNQCLAGISPFYPYLP
jgi:hypothetical protein